MPAPAAVTPIVPRSLRVECGAVEVEGHRLEDVVLGGWTYGPPLGSAPVVVVVGGITASPFPFGGGGAEGAGSADAWWPAMAGEGLIDPAAATVLCPCWPGNGSTWGGFDGPAPPPPISVLGLADLVAAWLDGSRASQVTTVTSAPADRRRVAPGSMASGWRPASTTWRHPSATSRSTMARPISESPPRRRTDWTRPKASRTRPV